MCRVNNSISQLADDAPAMPMGVRNDMRTHQMLRVAGTEDGGKGKDSLSSFTFFQLIFYACKYIHK